MEQLGKPTDTGTDTICGCINETFSNIYNVNQNIKIGVITPTPWIGQEPGQEIPEEYVKAIIDVCMLWGISCLDLFHESEMRPWVVDFNNTYYGDADGTHPNNAGHERYIVSAKC